MKRVILTFAVLFFLTFALTHRGDAAQVHQNRVIFYEPGTGLNGGVPNTVRFNLDDQELTNLSEAIARGDMWFSHGNVSINLYTAPVIDGVAVAPDPDAAPGDPTPEAADSRHR